MKILFRTVATVLFLISINTLPAFSSELNETNALNTSLVGTVEQNSALHLETNSFDPIVSAGQAVTFGIWKIYNDNDTFLYFLDMEGGRIIELWRDSNGWLIVVTEENGFALWSSGNKSSGYDIFGDNIAIALATEPICELINGVYSFGSWVIYRVDSDLTIMNPTGMEPNQETILTVDNNGIIHMGTFYTTIFDPSYPVEITVSINLKDDNDSNCLNINGNGTIPATIFGEETLDVSMIDQFSLSLSGLLVGIRGNDTPQCSIEYVNADEFYDLVCHFQDEPMNWLPGEATISLKGMLYDDTRIAGEDSLCIVP